MNRGWQHMLEGRRHSATPPLCRLHLLWLRPLLLRLLLRPRSLRSLESSLQKSEARAHVRRLAGLEHGPEARINMVGTFSRQMCLSLLFPDIRLADTVARSTPHLTPSSLRRFGLRLPSRDGERLPIVDSASRLGGLGLKTCCQALLTGPTPC